ncbi:MAG: NYN domain-containing protein [Patescibacteria group bacterium]
MLETKHRRVGVFIDIQNMYYSARNLYGQKVNFLNIVKAATGDQQLIRAIAYGVSTKTGDETAFFEALHNVGIEVMTKDLLEYDSGQKKGDWDVGITIDIVRMCDMLDVVVLVSGDGDYVPVGEYVKGRGRIFQVMSFRESTSTRLVDFADVYTNMSDDRGRFLISGGPSAGRPARRGEASIDLTSVQDEANNPANAHVIPSAAIAVVDEARKPRRYTRSNRPQKT